MNLHYLNCLLIFVTTCLVSLSNASAQSTAQEDNSLLKLRFDGLYSTYDTSTLRCGEKSNERYKTIDEVIFLANQHVFYNSRSVSFDLPVYSGIYIRTNGSKLVGHYKIVKDSLYVNVRTIFYGRGNRMKFLESHWSGYVKNPDTILAWKL